MSAEQTLEREQLLDMPREQAFEFFADAANLEAITPPWLGFRIVTPRPIEMRPGALIEYRLRLHAIPIRWRTRIEVWEPPLRFIDAQLSGPYAIWHHTHEFEAAGEATLMRDRVRYRIGFGPLGELARRALVERDLAKIFDYRRERIAALLKSA